LAIALFEAEFAACDLQALDEFAGAHEQHAPTVVDESEPDGCREMALAGAGWAEQEQIGALFEPAVASGERHHLRLADHRDDLEVEGRECLADRQTSFGKMALDAATAALRHLVLGERGEEARRRPAFLVGLLGELFHISLTAGRRRSVSSSSSRAASIEAVVFMPDLPRTGWRHSAAERRRVHHRLRAASARRQRPGWRCDLA
jgi:hypothetical protein